MEFYIWLIIAFVIGMLIGGYVFNYSGWRAYSREKKEFKNYKANLKRVLDAHAKEGLIMSYSDVENSIKRMR